MSERQVSDMNESGFSNLIDGHIDRMAKGHGEMPAEIYFDLLAERMEEQIEETLTLSIDVNNDDLVIHPDREMGDILIRGNEILIGKHRLVLQLSN